MILQPVVENAVNYGIRDIDYEGKICLSVFEAGGKINISIADNGTGMEQSVIDRIMSAKIEDSPALKERNISKDSNGIGLGNVINRLRLYYDREDVFDIESKGKNQGTKVTVHIPKYFEKAD
jgi:LytS/YehU family sensor histidine kinase